MAEEMNGRDFDVEKVRARLIDDRDEIHGMTYAADKMRDVADDLEREATRRSLQRENFAELVLKRANFSQWYELEDLFVEFDVIHRAQVPMPASNDAEEGTHA